MHRRLERLWVVGAMASVLTAGGCGSRSTEPVEGESQAHEHFPAHWPADLQGASQRLAEIVANPSEGSSKHTVAPKKEFIDLVLWLPILAADSDLGREPFARIADWSDSVASRWRDPDWTNKPLEAIVTDSQVQDMVRGLADICQQEAKRLLDLQQ